MRDVSLLFYALVSLFLVINCQDTNEQDVDNLIEEGLTDRLYSDLLQSIEKKFQVDLERTVESVLEKIQVLLQNGTIHIEDRLEELRVQLKNMNDSFEKEVASCLSKHQNETYALTEKTLHQMVVCGYSLIGHDPAHAVEKVINLKTMIKTGLKPLNDQKTELMSLLKICGHDHDSLRDVIKCVISKSPIIKTSMIDINEKLVEGVVSLTKTVSHGAMHEACLIEVIKSTENEAFELVGRVKNCVYRNSTDTAQTDTITQVPEEVHDDVKELS